jgi:protein ImuB
MAKRFVSIWFRHLTTDWFSLRQPQLIHIPFVLRAPSHGRMIVVAANLKAKQVGITVGMPLADARAIVPELEILDHKPELADKLLKRIGEWCIRFTPVVAVDAPDGLFFDATGCSHLWDGDQAYVDDIERKLNTRGYDVRVALADTPGVAWAMARFGKSSLIVKEGQHGNALLALPPEALRFEGETNERLHKLGLHQIRQFISMPRSSLRRRFGQHLISQIDKALGHEIEMLEPLQPVQLFQERLPCLEPIVTAQGIEIALQELSHTLCIALQKENKGLRTAILKCYCIDNRIESISIGTNRPSNNEIHLLKLFEPKLNSIEPGLGIELFVLEAPHVDDHYPRQEKMWAGASGLDNVQLSELIDRMAGKIGLNSIHRYLPDEHYWPERSYKIASSLQEKTMTTWRSDKIRPLHVLKWPEPIEVTAPIPDYPPMLFKYKGNLHKIYRADGPERIEQEWWLQQGEHRDYYRVEDEEGNRYWIFRLGHYQEKVYQWFIHGFFS